MRFLKMAILKFLATLNKNQQIANFGCEQGEWWQLAVTDRWINPTDFQIL